MIRKISQIENLAVFKNFKWDTSVSEKDGSVAIFREINILYGRNYSGKTTLSRIFRALETGKLSDKYSNPSFSIELDGSLIIDAQNLNNHGEVIRVFNEDFVKENLKFIIDDQESVKAFAILGSDNTEIEAEIQKIERELGNNEEGQETLLYAKLFSARSELASAEQASNDAIRQLENVLSTKATSGEKSIKYQSDLYGDQNYNIVKLRSDIEKVLEGTFQPISELEVEEHKKVVRETLLVSINDLSKPVLSLQMLIKQTGDLITKKVGNSNKIDELVRNAALNQWIKEGRRLHEDDHNICQFCKNNLKEDRWLELDRHFDEESSRLEQSISDLRKRIAKEKKHISELTLPDKSVFYSKYHSSLDKYQMDFEQCRKAYSEVLDKLDEHLRQRESNLFQEQIFSPIEDCTEEIQECFKCIIELAAESNSFTNKIGLEKIAAKEKLRLNEVYGFLNQIGYRVLRDNINTLKNASKVKQEEVATLKLEIESKRSEIENLRARLKDESIGAKKVSGYLSGFFGHQFLTLEAVEENISGISKKYKFEVMRDGKKAFHLSEGECSLIAFCYFMAKLGDVDTAHAKPIIWIDDPISSLDSNHVFFIYSIINDEIVKQKKYEQLFLSTHNLDFLKYLKRLPKANGDAEKRLNKRVFQYLLVQRKHDCSDICVMPDYLREYVTEFNYLFEQIHRCAEISEINDSNYTLFYNFGNNARKFLEIYLYYKYPDDAKEEDKMIKFFGEQRIPAVFTDRINNEYSHLCGVFERGATPVEVPEMKLAANAILERIKAIDFPQYQALMKSIGHAVSDNPIVHIPGAIYELEQDKSQEIAKHL